ncbi:hypothetical protein V1514DRAFT_326247 [Lipomyces japonicus]|uniref:uncharacterized protein n=1 Tax=Lipomyces japonicus TaxID=56871 RepID=UPI0034CEA3C4
MSSIRTATKRLLSTSTSTSSSSKLTVGYVPEHFSTPLFFAQQNGSYSLGSPEFVPFVSGTGHMIESLKNKEIDVAVGLTEGFVAGLGKGADFYKIIGTYVQSPLCWAISTGINRADVSSIDSLKGGNIGISRIGSGSYVMPFVLAKQQGWTTTTTKSLFNFKILNNFKNLRDGVNSKIADAFLWEFFTSKRYYDSQEIKYVDRIYTPWPSWTITARTDIIESSLVDQLKSFLSGLNDGITFFNQNPENAIKHISTNLDYTAQDASEWIKTVEFAKDVGKIDKHVIVDNTVEILAQAGVITDAKSLDTSNFIARL